MQKVTHAHIHMHTHVHSTQKGDTAECLLVLAFPSELCISTKLFFVQLGMKAADIVGYMMDFPPKIKARFDPAIPPSDPAIPLLSMSLKERNTLTPEETSTLWFLQLICNSQDIKTGGVEHTLENYVFGFLDRI